MKKTKLMLGDNIESLKKLPDNSVDSVVTDPPYGLSFMNKKWDYDVPSVEFWTEVYRVLKPGGHILSFGGTRTYHRMVVNIEDAGFEIRDQIQWIYGSGFPKSHNIGKAVDKIEGNEREFIRKQTNVAGRNDTLIGDRTDSGAGMYSGTKKEIDVTKGNSPYEGWGTALKPANEPICVARKPLSEKSVAENVLKWGTGGINVDGCRVGSESMSYVRNEKDRGVIGFGMDKYESETTEGRFPANIILDETAAELLDEQSEGSSRYFLNIPEEKAEQKSEQYRFLYQAKVSKKERNLGLDLFEDKIIEGRDKGQDDRSVAYKKRPSPTKNTHPTLKPINLMTYLCRLITPPGGIVLDPFMGSGSTGISAQLEGFRFVGMELDEDYFKIAEARINSYEEYRKLIK